MNSEQTKKSSDNQNTETVPNEATEIANDDSESESGKKQLDEDEDAFSSLISFATSSFATLSSPAEPLTSEERQPRPLSSEGHTTSQILKLLQDLITYDDEEPEVSYGVSALDVYGHLAMLSHTIAAVVTTLDQQHLRRLATRIISDTCLWISRLFRFFDSTAYFHEDAREGVVCVCRMLLHTRYPKFSVDGYESLYARPPVIYTSAAVRTDLPHHIVSMLGLGVSCIRVVPCNKVVGAPVTIDTAALDRMMAEDSGAQRKPFIVLANCGGGDFGGVDNITHIQELCHKYEAWLHVEGHALASLVLPNTPHLPARVGDSVTLPLSIWLGVASLPYVTLYRPCDASAVHAAGLTSLSLHVRLACLPLWTTLQCLGQNGVISRLQHTMELSNYFQQQLVNLPNIRLLSHAPTEGSVTSVQDLITRPVSTAQLLESVCGSVVFQYVSNKTSEDKNSEYYDNLNSWLGQVVRRDVGIILLELVQVESAGLVLRWSAFENLETHHISLDDMKHLLTVFHHQIEILFSTVRHKEKFVELVKETPNLELTEIPGWAGLGGVRFIPDICLGQDHFSDSAREDINALNIHLVSMLKATDSAFSLGESQDGLNCVRFGMVTSETDVSDLLTLVLEMGREIESSSRFLDQMTEVVKKGIETATEDLQRENEERLWQEGILRHVPIVGSVYNWLSPPPPAGIRGRMLDLTAGILESTENIYKYHMQIRHGSSPSGVEDKLPPAPIVMTPVTPDGVTPAHSRTSSSTSAPVGKAHSRETSDNTRSVENAGIPAPSMAPNGPNAL